MTIQAIVVVIEGSDRAGAVAAEIGHHLAPAHRDLAIHVPPRDLLGAAFWLSDGAPEWWEETVGDVEGSVLVVTDHHHGVTDDLGELDTEWIVCCPTPEVTATVPRSPNVVVVTATGTQETSSLVVRALSHHPSRLCRPTWGPFRRSQRPSSVVSPAATPASDPMLLARHAPSEPSANGNESVSEPRTTEGSCSVALHDPIGESPRIPDGDIPSLPPVPAQAQRFTPPPLPLVHLASVAAIGPAPLLPFVPPGPPMRPLAALASQQASATPAPGMQSVFSTVVDATPAARPGPISRLRRHLSCLVSTDDVDLGALGRQLVDLHDTVVLVLSRKGGSGKSTAAVGLAVAAARAVEGLGGSVALLDQNLNNADLSRMLKIPVGAPTVRELLDALARGAQPPRGLAVRDTMLEVFPEERETTPSDRVEIARIAAHLRGRYTLSVIDLSNVLPDAMGSPDAAAVEWWLDHANVVVIPTDASKPAWESAAETVDAAMRSGMRRVADGGGKDAGGEDAAGTLPFGMTVPFLVQPGADAMSEPQIANMVAHLNAAQIPVIPIPVRSEVQMAGWRDQNMAEVSPPVTAAYRRLLAAAVEVRKGGITLG